jgi:restriction system protein
MDPQDINKLLDARKRLESLRRAWPLPVGQERAPTKPKARPAGKRAPGTQKLKRGQKTPEDAYFLPILQALDEMSGRAATSAIVDRVGEIMGSGLNDYDCAAVPSGELRWRNTAEWARYSMVQQDLLAADSPKGTWEITGRGRAYLREQQRPPL